MKTKRLLKLLPVWLAVSAVIIIAGIILAALLGFNTAPDRAKSYSFEVRYDVSVAIDEEKVAALEKACDDAFAQAGVCPSDRQDGVDSTLNMTTITYIFNGTTDVAKLEGAKNALQGAFASTYPNADVRAEYHAVENIPDLYYEIEWRGAVALTVGAVVGLIYIGIRFGVGCALTGLCTAAHDALFTVAFFALTRIPVYAYAPLLFAAVAAVFSMALWLIQCMALRDAKKDPAGRGMEAAEAVGAAWEANWKKIVIIAAAGVAIFAVAGGIAAAGARLFLLPGMVPVAVAAYSSLLLGPSLHVPVKAAFDKLSANRKPRYFGKKKGDKSAEKTAGSDT